MPTIFLVASPHLEWMVLPEAGYWIGALIGGMVPQAIATLIYWRALGRSHTAVPVIAGMFTVQSCSACGAAPGPLEFVTVINSIVVAVVFGAIMKLRASKRTETQAPPR